MSEEEHDDFQEEHHQHNRDILKDLINNSPDDIAIVLRLYDYDKDGDMIYNQLHHKCYKQQLQAAADHLQQLPKTFRYKDDLVRAIISRIDSLLLEKCLKCGSFYALEIDDKPTVSCTGCGQGAHESCYHDLGDTLKHYPGLQFLCSRCDKNQPRGKVITLQINDDTIDNPADMRQDAQAHINNMHIPLHSNDDRRDRREWRDEDTRPTCEQYRRGSCPHGISGRTLVDGQQCFYNHPKRCTRFCRFGPDSREGCNRGRDCDRMHPILCKFSLKYKLCTNLKCKFTHLKMTKRYKPRDIPEQQESSRDETYPQHNTNVRSDRPLRSPTVQQTDQLPNETAVFLAKLPELFKEMQQQLREVKEIQQTHQYQQMMPWYTTVAKPVINQPPPGGNQLQPGANQFQQHSQMVAQVPTLPMFQHPQ